MKIGQRFIIAACAAAVGVYAIWMIADRAYFARRDRLVAAIQQDQKSLEAIRTAREAHIDIRDDLQAIADRTLGSSEEVVDAQLRSRLNTIAREIGLVEPAVSTGRADRVASPLKRELSRNNPYRDEIDFAELDGTITGSGSLEQVVRLMHRVQHEPWHKRIHSFVIDPRPDGQFDVTLRLRTLFLPGLAPAGDDPGIYEGRGLEPFLALAANNPFAKPTPVEVAGDPPVETQTTQEPTQPAYDYGRWRVTMVTSGTRGGEVWLLDTESKKSRTLIAGEGLRDVEVIEVLDDSARFRAGEEEFIVQVGATLADRSPVQLSDSPR